MVKDTAVIVEGTTSLVVPRGSVTSKVPPRVPAFFNAKAKLNRDLSLVVYKAFADGFSGPKVFLDGLSGIGARGLRVANELKMDGVTVNDANPQAVTLARESAKINKISKIEFSEDEVCRFFSRHSEKFKRGSMVDVDPFGSPAPFFDCGLRATMHGGILSCTATDLQVLNGLFQDACKRRYGGIPTRTEYGNEIAIRLVLGCLKTVADRLGVGITPIFVENNLHYYRVYVRVANRPDQMENTGYILHCAGCGHRRVSSKAEAECEMCSSHVSMAGPLWIGRLFEKEFVQSMTMITSELAVDKNCEKILTKALLESEMPGTYYTSDEIAAKTKSSPPKLDDIVSGLQESGFLASPTAFNPTGFRTNASINDVEKLF